MERDSVDDIGIVLRKLAGDDRWVNNILGSFILPLVEGEVTVANARVEPGFHVDLHFSCAGDQDDYSLERYTAHLVVPPPFEHFTSGSTDTQAIEKLMASIDWRRSYAEMEKDYLVLSPGDQERLLLYTKAIYNLIMLSASPKGEKVADALKLRYLTGTEHGERFIYSDVLERNTRSADFYVQGARALDFARAKNILAGRPVFIAEEEGYWLSKPAGVTGNAEKEATPATCLYFQGERRYADYDLEGMLEALPLKQRSPEILVRMAGELRTGHSVNTTIRIRGKAREVMLAADASQASLLCTDMMGRHLELRGLRVENKPAKRKNRGKRL